MEQTNKNLTLRSLNAVHVLVSQTEENDKHLFIMIKNVINFFLVQNAVIMMDCGCFQCDNCFTENCNYKLYYSLFIIMRV